MIRTLIIIDVQFYRQGLEGLLTRSGEVQIVGAVSSAEDAQRVAEQSVPDVVLLDIGAPDSSNTLRQLRHLRPTPKIVALAVSEAPEIILDWAESGIAAYVPRNASLDDLIQVLRGVVRDELYCSPQVAATMFRRLASLATPSERGDRVDSLSIRERQVLSLIARGLSNKAIALQLGIAAATAKNHVHNILDKLQLHGRVEAATLLQRSRSRDSGRVV